jgi:hypothetical protein
MQIQFPTHLATPLASRLAPTLPWSVNDLLVAKVVGKTAENFTRLAIGERIVMARTDALLEVGQKLNLKVTATGTTTVMQVVPDRPPAAASAVDRGLARVLPQQATPQDTARLLRSLDALSTNLRGLTETVGRGAAATLSQDLQNLRNALPKAEQMQVATTLRVALEQATLPTEARLLSAVQDAGQPDVSRDMRAQFARLAADLATLPPAVRNELDKFVQQTLHADAAVHGEAPTVADDTVPTPTTTPGEHRVSELKTLVESVVARLESNQLQTVANPPGQAQPLVVDLPVVREQHTDLLHLEVESDAHHTDSDSAPRTSVTLNLKLDGGHEFSARLHLSGDSLSLRLGSTDAEFNDQISARIGELEHGLSDAGLEVNQIFIAPLAVSARPRIGARQLINERV